MRTFLLLALFVCLLLPACGDGETASEPPAPEPVDIDEPVRPRAIGQEVWVPYEHEKHTRAFPKIRLRSRAETLEFVNELRQDVLDGDDLGDVAYNNSFAPGRFVGGYSGIVNAPGQNDREKMMLALPEGQLSGVIEFDHGFWFGRVLSEKRGAAFQSRYDSADTIRARARLIHIHYAFAHPRRAPFDKYSKEQAIAKARQLIARIQAGEDFGTLAGGNSNDSGTRARGGRMLQPDAEPGKPPTEWIQWHRNTRQAHYFYPILEAVLETAPVGRVMPEPLVSRYGVDVIFVEDRQGP